MRGRFSVLAVVVLMAIVCNPAYALSANQAGTPCPDAPLTIVLQADSGSGVAITGEQLEQNREVITQRLIGLGIDDAVVTISGDDRIDITFQRAGDATDEVLRTLQQTGLLEFIDPRGEYLYPGTYVTTTLGRPSSATPIASSDEAIYRTIVDSSDIRNVYATTDSVGQPAIAFVLAARGRDVLVSYTRSHIGKTMSIVFDKQVVTSPTINAIIFGEGIIAGVDAAEIPALLAVLTSKPLSFPMSIAETQTAPSSATCADPTD